MLLVLSPAKTLDFDTPPTTRRQSAPEFAGEAATLIEALRGYAPQDLAALMSLSDPLARLNVDRYASWSAAATPSNAKQAVLAFDGDVYEGLDAPSLDAGALGWLQSHLRILSGLYGVLRPLDLLQPYRLEMGTRLPTARGATLYAFWGNAVTDALHRQLRSLRSKTLVNLASEEYFRVVRPARLDARIITPVFEDWKGGRYKVISFYAKRARGLMVRHAALRRAAGVEALKDFAAEGYAYDPKVSEENVWVFRRRRED
ncbi:MAG: peroxide stress protein YaaA [Burkholderiaceae bacterium]